MSKNSAKFRGNKRGGIRNRNTLRYRKTYMRLEPVITNRAINELRELGIKTNRCVMAKSLSYELHP
jgi:hypothetical protein